MSRIIKKMPSFNGVGAGQTAIVNLPVGLTYNTLVIKHRRSGTLATEAQMKAEIGDIRVIIDGDVKITLSATELLDMLKYYGISVSNGILPLIFSRPWARNIAGEDALAYGTADVQTMSVEVDIDASATAPTLEVKAVQSAPSKLGQHVTIRRFGDSASATGILENSTLPKGNYGLLALHATTDSIGDVKVQANNRVVYESDEVDGPYLDSLTGKAWQTGYTHINFATTDRMSDALNLNLQDFRVELDMTSTGSFNLIAERIDTHVPAQGRRAA